MNLVALVGRMHHAPAIIEVDSPRLEEVLGRVEQVLAEGDAALIRAVFASYRYVAEMVDNKNTSTPRLRELLFRGRTEKTAIVVGRPAEAPGTTLPHAVPTAPAAGAADPDPTSPAASDPSAAADQRPAASGHGRLAADAYRGAERVAEPHATLRAGDACPACGEGIVYDKAPGVLVRVTGQSPTGSRRREAETSRC